MNPKAKDNLVYLGVASVIVAALAFYVFYTDATMGRIPRIPGPILWGVVSTPVIVALMMERFWPYRRQPLLWASCLVAAAVNATATFVAYSFRWSPPVIVWSVLSVLWVIFVYAVTEKVLVRHSGAGGR